MMSLQDVWRVVHSIWDPPWCFVAKSCLWQDTEFGSGFAVHNVSGSQEVKRSTMGHYPTGPTACILDPTCHVMITSMWDGGPVCIFVFWVTVVLSCSTFFLWKQHYLKKHPVKPVVLQVGNLKGASHANQSSQSVPLQCNQRQYHNFCSQSCCGSILNPNTFYTWWVFSSFQCWNKGW